MPDFSDLGGVAVDQNSQPAAAALRTFLT